MRLLSRKEEMILLAVWKGQGQAYGVSIRAYIERMTGQKWLFGAIYNPLGRLVEMGLVEQVESEPLPEPGGRRRNLYRLTEAGKQEMIKVRTLNEAMWADVPALESDR
ncbi:MAG: helix-turn-helix transcriptional regulator [Acidobacteria bacterium]|nr:helix-turn-helix transcriptional regulator [Acidobacteriota bacterium]